MAEKKRTPKSDASKRRPLSSTSAHKRAARSPMQASLRSPGGGIRRPSPEHTRISDDVLNRFDARLLAAKVETKSMAAYRALPRKVRRERLRALIEDEFRKSRGAEDRQARRIEAEARCAGFMTSWKGAEARLELIRVHHEERLAHANWLLAKVNKAKKHRSLTDEDVQPLADVMEDIRELDGLGDTLESAMANATKGVRALDKKLALWDAGERWGVFERLTSELRGGRSPANLQGMARVLGVPEATLCDAIAKHEGDRAADGPVRAAAKIVGGLVKRHRRTVEKPPAQGRRFFSRLASLELGAADEPDLAGTGVALMLTEPLGRQHPGLLAALTSGDSDWEK